MLNRCRRRLPHLHLETSDLYDIFYHNNEKPTHLIDYVVIPREQKGKNDVYDPLITSYETLGYIKKVSTQQKSFFILEEKET